MNHTIGSHSDDRGGESDYPCNCLDSNDTPTEDNKDPKSTSRVQVDNLELKIEEAIRDGLSNHTGEWFNPFIAPGLGLDNEKLVDLLLYIVKAKRLNLNIQKIIQEQQKALIGEDIPKDWDDSFDSVQDWEYYDDYHSNAYDFVRGYNKAKAEQRTKLNQIKDKLS